MWKTSSSARVDIFLCGMSYLSNNYKSTLIRLELFDTVIAMQAITDSRDITTTATNGRTHVTTILPRPGAVMIDVAAFYH